MLAVHWRRPGAFSKRPISRREKGVEADLRNLVQAYRLQPEIGHPVPDTDREADLFVPELRLATESKRVGKADVPEGDLATRTGEEEPRWSSWTTTSTT